MKKHIVALAGAMLAAACGLSLPDVPDCEPEEYQNTYPQLREVLTLLWHDKWGMTKCPPKVVLVHQEDTDRSSQGEGCLPDVPGVCPQGVYRPYEGNGTIYLMSPWEALSHNYPDRLWTRTTLAHDLYHAYLLLTTGDTDHDHLRSEWWKVYPDGGPVQWEMYRAGYFRPRFVGGETSLTTKMCLVCKDLTISVAPCE